MKKKVVMQDIADELNISKNSVSQALSGKDGVSEETRMKIIQTAEKMGYRYSKKKSDNADKPVRTVGLIASDYAFSMKNFFGEIYLSIEREAQRHGVNLRIQSITPAARNGLVLPAFIEDGSIDGVLMLSHISTDYMNKVLDQGIPAVLIDHHHPLIEADAVLTNNRFGAYLAVKHLIDLGHRDIAVIGNKAVSPSYQERWEGYMLALQEHGIEPAGGLMFPDVPEEEPSIGETIRSLSAQPTAWFCLNDGFGFFVCNTLKAMGYRIPEDISVCGFDNSDFAHISAPKLTTMHIDLTQFAHKAFAQLLWRIRHPNETVHEILLPTKLIERESTGPNPQRTGVKPE